MSSADLVHLKGLGSSLCIVTDVSERKRAEMALEESEERYRSLVELSPDAIVVGRDDKLAFANSAAAKLFGADKPSDLIGTNPLDLIHPDFRDSVRRRTEQVMSGRTVPDTEMRCIRLDGTEYWGEARGGQVVLHGETAVLGIVRDITERKRAEEESKEREFLLRAMTEGATEGIFVKDLEGRYLMMNEAGVRLIGAKADKVVGMSDFDVFPAEVARRIVVDDKEILDLGRSRSVEKVVVVDGAVRTMLTTKGPCRDAGLRSIGLVGVFRDITERKMIEDELRKARNELQLKVQERTAHLAAANESLEHEIEQHRAAQRALAESENRYRNLVQFSPDAISILQNGVFVFVNSAAANLYGVASSDDLIGKNPLELISPEHRDLARGRMESIAAGGSVPFVEFEIVRVDGMKVAVEAAAMRFDYRGEPAIHSILRDVSERKKAEKALQQSEARFAKAFHANPAMMALIDLPSRTYVDANEKWLSILDYARDEVLGKTQSELSIWDDTAERDRIHQAIREEGSVRDIEAAFRTRGGDLVEVLLAAEMIELEGEQRLLGVAIDITKRKRAEEALAETESRLATVVANAPIILWSVDREGEVTLSEGAGLKAIGLESGELIGRSADEFPQDYETIPRALVGRRVYRDCQRGRSRVQQLPQSTSRCEGGHRRCGGDRSRYHRARPLRESLVASDGATQHNCDQRADHFVVGRRQRIDHAVRRERA